jgi:uncharacterized UPF0160 family protein
LQSGQAIYIVYPDDTAGQWRIQAVPVGPQSFDSRKPLPEVWRGLRDDQLDEVTGIEGCVFVHASGFIGGARHTNDCSLLIRLTALCKPVGNKTKSGALLLAKTALEM